MIKIPKEEFVQRIQRIQQALEEQKLDGMLVYGDEYRKENLRYVSDFWPIFERGSCFIPKKGDPILAGAPEGQEYAREMSVWEDIRNLKEFTAVTVPEEIDYPLADFSSLAEILSETLAGGKRLGLVGRGDISSPVMALIENSIPGLEIVDCDDVIAALRVIKSEAEIACLKEAGRQACAGYEQLMAMAVPGNKEVMAAAAGEGAARMAGAEDVNFTVFGTGARTNTIIGRATGKIIEDGDMVMACMAVQYQGYVASTEFPFVAGKMSDDQKKFIDVLLEAANVQLDYLKDGVIAGEMVRSVRAVFKKHNMQKYDVYPPMHGIGLAEAESPYPDAKATYPLRSGMCVNSDISLFGHSLGGNRIEEGFVIGSDGPASITPLIRSLCENR